MYLIKYAFLPLNLRYQLKYPQYKTRKKTFALIIDSKHYLRLPEYFDKTSLVRKVR